MAMSVAENANDGEVAGYDVTFTANTGDVAGSEGRQVYLCEAGTEGIQTSKYAIGRL